MQNQFNWTLAEVTAMASVGAVAALTGRSGRCCHRGCHDRHGCRGRRGLEEFCSGVEGRGLKQMGCRHVGVGIQSRRLTTAKFYSSLQL